MKKTYIQPQIKTRHIKVHTILAGSTTGVNTTEGVSGSSDNEFVGDAKQGGIFNWGNSDSDFEDE